MKSKVSIPNGINKKNHILKYNIQSKKIETEYGNKIKVFMLVDSFYEGGLEKVVVDLALKFNQSGHDCEILSISNSAGTNYNFAIKNKIKVVSFENNIHKFKHYLKENDFQIILIHHSYKFLEEVFEFKKPIIEIIHNVYFWQVNDKKIHKLRDQVSFFVSVSSFVHNYSTNYLDIPKNKILRINNGLNISGLLRPTLNFLRNKRLKSINNPIFLVVANFNEQKNHILIIQSFAVLLKKYPNARLYLAGNNESKSDYLISIRKLVSNLKISDSVNFLGTLNRRNLSLVLSQSHVALLPSLFEGFSISSLEYLFYGLPTILSETGATAELYKYFKNIKIAKNCSVPPGDLSVRYINELAYNPNPKSIDSLAKSMSFIVENYSNMLEIALQNTIDLGSLSIDETFKKYEELIFKLLKEPVIEL